jgi:hypothetical protein
LTGNVNGEEIDFTWEQQVREGGNPGAMDPMFDTSAPKRFIAKRVPEGPLDLDQTFARGSGVSLTSLSGVQIANLATLGKVWGFLKYHHPAIADGQHHWDYDLFRELPKIPAAADRDSVSVRAAYMDRVPW